MYVCIYTQGVEGNHNLTVPNLIKDIYMHVFIYTQGEGGNRNPVTVPNIYVCVYIYTYIYMYVYIHKGGKGIAIQ
jgi:hypothetical protein